MTGILPPTPAVLRSYRASLYHAAGLDIRIGARVPILPDAGEWTLLSGANPGGRHMPAGWNHRAMRRLAARLRRVTHCPGEGRLGRWSEPLLLARLPAGRAAVLARRFRQNAIVRLRRGRTATLLLL